MKKLCTYIYILLFGISYSNASDIIPGNQKIEKFVSEQGFFQNTIHAITSDKNGYIWIATPNGLARYDGYSFEYFYHDFYNLESIPGNKVKHLLNDSHGKLWIGTDQGLCIYLTGKEQFVSLKYNISDETFIKEDNQKKIWVGQASKLHIFKSELQFSKMVEEAVVLDLEKELNGESIIDIEFLADAEVLLATTSSIYKVTYKEGQNYSYAIDKLLLDYDGNGINKIIKTENTVWIGTNNGIYKTVLENNRLTFIELFFSSINQTQNNSINVLTLFFDKEKNLWIGSRRNGVLKYNSETESFETYKFDSKNVFGLTSNRINCFYEDAFGVIWIGTAQGGLNKLDKHQKPFQNYAHNPYDNQSLPSNLINSIFEDKKGRIWISFFDNIISRSNVETDITEQYQINFDRLDKQLGELKDEIVVRIFQDLKGYWWIGTQDGLYLYDETNKKLRQVHLESVDGIFSTLGNRIIEQTNPNQILIGGSSHVYLLNEPWDWVLNNKPIPVDSKLFDFGGNISVLAFNNDEFGNFWFGTLNGIYQVIENNNKYVVKNHLSTNHEDDRIRLTHDHIFCIHKSRDGNMWVGSFGGGLMKITLNQSGEPVKMKRYHKKDGLPDEAVYGILEDDDGKLWMSTDMGLCRFDPVSEKFEIYDVNDGILNNNFRQAAYFKTKTGLMLMGGLNGLTIFNPEHITKNEIPPTVIISSLKINNQQIVAGRKFNNKDILENSIIDTRQLVLDNKNRNISLDIIVQHTSAPKKNRLSYMLEGVNENWIEFDGGKTTASYNLNAGAYRFLYKGANGDGIWSESTGELLIKVLSPWYLRWWSLVVWGACVLLLAFGIFWYLIRLEKLKQKLKFEHLDNERVHEMDQAKLRFFTNISHEFKTPLSLIIGPFEKIEEQNNVKENQKYFSIIQNNIARLQRLIEQLISYRKAETGHLQLKYTKTTLGNFIYPLLEAFEERAKNINVHFYYKVNEPNRRVVIDIDKTEGILLNLISNAVKFTEFNGDVSVEAGFIDGQNGEMLYFEVTDSGIGIPPEKIDKIFNRFYRGVDDGENWSGTGIGLALCKSLTDLMKGTISVKSEVGKKTIFKIELPFVQDINAEVKHELNKHREIVTDWIDLELYGNQEQTSNPTLPEVLVADDELGVRNFLQEALKSKYNITLAKDGEDAWKKLNENIPQLVISDVMMPKLDGYQLCERIKSEPATCHIPIILLTAHDETDKEISGIEAGADDFISKPFSIKHLEVRIRKLIENKKRLIEYFSQSSVLPKDDFGMSVRDRNFLEKLSSSIEKNLSNSAFGVEELASDVGISTSHFYRRLKELTGVAPNVYLRNFRLQKAAQLLKEKRDLNVNEVMFEIGIESASYFSAAFKKLFGVSPSEYIKNKKID